LAPTESESIQPSAKRQKTSTIESDINLNVSSKQPTTHGPPLLSIEDTPVKAEVILIKDESEEQAEESIVAEETQQVETHHPSNNTEMPSKYPATLSTIEALELAEKCMDKYAGRHTKELEEKLKAFM
jgi:PhoPQ-activated pathogenicity-related protein